MNTAGHAPDVASAANISAFTLGSAIGISLGGAKIDGGLGLASVNWVGGIITGTGLIVTVLTWALLDVAPRPKGKDHSPSDAGELDHRATTIGHHHGDEPAEAEQAAVGQGHRHGDGRVARN